MNYYVWIETEDGEIQEMVQIWEGDDRDCVLDRAIEAFGINTDSEDYDEDEQRDSIEKLITEFLNVPNKFNTPGKLHDELFEWLELEDDQKEYTEKYWDEIDDSASIDSINDAYVGKFSTIEGFAEHYCNESNPSLYEDCSNYVYNNIDWRGVWDSELTHSFIEIAHKGEFIIFSNI